jgi:hypothetical protein
MPKSGSSKPWRAKPTAIIVDPSFFKLGRGLAGYDATIKLLQQ